MTSHPACGQEGCTSTFPGHFHPRMESQIGWVVQGAEYADRVWLDWLADIGYGVDFTHNPPPPCEPRDLAEVYAERDGEDVDDWAAILLDGNTAGGWYGNGKDSA